MQVDIDSRGFLVFLLINSHRGHRRESCCPLIVIWIPWYICALKCFIMELCCHTILKNVFNKYSQLVFQTVYALEGNLSLFDLWCTFHACVCNSECVSNYEWIQSLIIYVDLKKASSSKSDYLCWFKKKHQVQSLIIYVDLSSIVTLYLTKVIFLVVWCSHFAHHVLKSHIC